MSAMSERRQIFEVAVFVNGDGSCGAWVEDLTRQVSTLYADDLPGLYDQLAEYFEVES